MNQLERANHGKKAAWQELETDLLGWIMEKRNNGLEILPPLVRLKALERAQRMKSIGFQPGSLRQETTGASVL